MNIDGKWQLPPKYRLSEKVLEESRQYQIELQKRMNSPFTQMSPREHARARAPLEIEDLETQLESLDRELGQSLLKGSSEPIGEQRRQVLEQLSEVYARIGRYDLAAMVAPDEETRRGHLEMIEAIKGDDTVDCDCPDPKGTHPTTRKYREAIVWDVEMGRERHVIKCSKCGHRNATLAMPKELAKMARHRSDAIQSLSHLADPRVEEKRLNATHANLMK